MTKWKKPQKDDSQVEEIDLSSIDLSTIDLEHIAPIDSGFPAKSKKSSHDDSPHSEVLPDDLFPKLKWDDIWDDSTPDVLPEIAGDFDDDFDDDFDEPEWDEETDGEEKSEWDWYKSPKNFFTDKRRKKTVKKFIDVTVPQEYLEGMSDPIQLIFRKGKSEWKLVYDEVISALPPGDDIELMDEVFSRLAKLGIELVDSLDQEDIFRDAGKKNQDIDLSEISDDSIRMYLNEIRSEIRRPVASSLRPISVSSSRSPRNIWAVDSVSSIWYRREMLDSFEQ
jgi:Sigma-70 factor, region 1.1